MPDRIDNEHRESASRRQFLKATSALVGGAMWGAKAQVANAALAELEALQGNEGRFWGDREFGTPGGDCVDEVGLLGDGPDRSASVKI